MSIKNSMNEPRPDLFERLVWAGRNKSDWRSEILGDQMTQVGQIWQGPGGGIYEVMQDPIQLVWVAGAQSELDDPRPPDWWAPMRKSPGPVPEVSLEDKVFCNDRAGRQYTVTVGDVVERGVKDSMLVRFNSPETHDAVKAAAKRTGMPAAEWLRRAVTEKLARDGERAAAGRVLSPDGRARSVCLDVDFDLKNWDGTEEYAVRIHKITDAIETLVQALGGTGVLVREHEELPEGLNITKLVRSWMLT